DRTTADADRAIASLDESGQGTAAVMIDSSFINHGIIDVPEGYLAAVVEKVRAAGGVFIADEVQAGFGRMGSHMWGCQSHGVEAEIVTLGKPIGNGLALGAVIATPEILASFTERSGYFSTFGGNPVACAAGSAVLDVIEREELLANAVETGEYLRTGLRTLAQRHPLIGDVRGSGMLAGVELVRDRATLEPAKEETKRVINHLKENGVLVGREGHFGNVLKIRPPMVFNRDNADTLIAALGEAVAAI
ncbi:MAG: aminotransferase class III-fold pyridoxal phosphate-dependent enzyme, partial [Planctomycetes bacterium]|nr:aminotransferase class III-fold pyridoxal phosphate-dependent enzyme [Planctomycetota bacterium]